MVGTQDVGARVDDILHCEGLRSKVMVISTCCWNGVDHDFQGMRDKCRDRHASHILLMYPIGNQLLVFALNLRAPWRASSEY